MWRTMYFILVCEDLKRRVFKCEVKLSRTEAKVNFFESKHEVFLQKDSDTTYEASNFTIYFHTENGYLQMGDYYIRTCGLVRYKRDSFLCSYEFYFNGDSNPHIILGSLERGNF